MNTMMMKTKVASWSVVLVWGLVWGLMGCNEEIEEIQAVTWSDDDSQQAFVFNDFEYGKVDTYDPYHPFGHQMRVFVQNPDGSERRPVGPIFKDVTVPQGQGIYFMKQAGYLLVPRQCVVGINELGDVEHTLISLETGQWSVLHTTTAEEPPDMVVPSPDGQTIAVVRQRVLEKVADEARRPVVIEVYLVQGDFSDPEAERVVTDEHVFTAERRLELRWVDDARLHFYDSHEVRVEVGLGVPPMEIEGVAAPLCEAAPATSSSPRSSAEGREVLAGGSLSSPIVEGEVDEACKWE